MDNQHRKITGYRELDAKKIELINQIKKNANELGLVFDVLEGTPDSPSIDKRALAIAKTNLQTGFMWFVRAIAQPEGF